MISAGATTQNASKDALGALEAGSGSGGLRFPDDLSDNYITFTVNPRNRETKSKDVESAAGAMIALPIPSNLSTGYGAQYDTGTGIGVLGSVARDATAAGATDIQSLAELARGDELGNALVQQAKAIGLGASPEILALLGAGVSGPLGAGVGAALGGVARGAAVGAGIAVNPHLAVIFDGVNFRTHSFQYKFSPRSSGESNNVREIIKIFKKHMLPTLADGNAFFEYPDEFKIKFNSKNEKFLFKIGTSVLTDFQINYNPDGGSYFHQNGAPVSVSMQLSFTEIDILTQDKIEEGY